MNGFPENFDLDNREFKYAEKLILYSNRSIYLTGKAGTGKSTFLRYIAANTRKNYVIVAPTGIAAINAGGVTINSFFELPFTPFVWSLFSESQKVDFYNYSSEKRKIIEKADLIIIDEISMVRSDTIDAIDYRLRNFGGKRNLPFGGKQVLFVGDTFQLEPIAKSDDWNILKDYYTSHYFFSAKTFKEVEFINIELQKVYRQKDDNFISLLNKVRTKKTQLQDLHELNKSFDPNFNPDGKQNYITLATRRDIVDATNLRKIKQLEGRQYKFEGIIEGKFGKTNSIVDDLLPTNKTLDLKVNAQVMFVKNDRGGRWVNGTIGKITELSEDSIEVSISKDGITNTHKLDKASWENVKYEIDETTGKIVEKVIGTFFQYPIKLAWAITINKSQGLTFDNVIIDMGGGAFSAGQTYVALSRCRTFAGIKLRTEIKLSDIIVRDEVLKLSETANNEKLISDELTDGQANYYYKESLCEFDKSNFRLAFENLNKAFEFRNDLNKTYFKRLLGLKLQRLKSNNDKYKTLEKLISTKDINIETLTKSISEKDAIIDKLNEELLNKSNQLSELKNYSFELESETKHLKLHNQDLCSQIEELDNLNKSLNIINSENNIRLENAIKRFNDSHDLNNELKAEIKSWKKYTLIAGLIICIIVFILLFKI